MTEENPKPRKSLFLRLVLWIFGLAAAGVSSAALLFVFLFAIVYAQLPDMASVRDYSPKLPMKIWSADGELLAEFGEERRDFVPIATLPKTVKLAILAAEDAEFYEHSGVDFSGIGRALISNILAGKKARAARPSPCRWHATAFFLQKKAICASSTRLPSQPSLSGN